MYHLQVTANNVKLNIENCLKFENLSNIPIVILVLLEYWWLVSLNEIIFFFIFLFELYLFTNV